VESKAANQKVVEQLRDYFRGRRHQFELPLDLCGSPFQLQVWQALQDIPFGSTRTYKQVATAAGSPRAPRAAGAACGRNRVPLIVPCHRAVGSDGSLTGFGGGLSLKRQLLAHEQDSAFSLS
jgi:O-6-methylguanine DNA methyltransferase